MDMNSLVKEYKGQALTSSKLVAERFKKRHTDVLRAINNLNCSNMFRQRNFALRLKTRQLATGSTQEKFFTMTKDGFTFLVMGFTGADASRFKEEYIRAFNTMEEYIKGEVPKDLPSALRAYALEVETRKVIQKKLEEAEPHVSFSKIVQGIDKELDMKKVAAVIGEKGFGRNKLFKFLRETKVFMQDNIPYRLYITRGYFTVIETIIPTSSGDKLFTQTMVSQKGLDFIIKLLYAEGVLKPDINYEEVK